MSVVALVFMASAAVPDSCESVAPLGCSEAESRASYWDDGLLWEDLGPVQFDSLSGDWTDESRLRLQMFFDSDQTEATCEEGFEYSMTTRVDWAGHVWVVAALDCEILASKRGAYAARYGRPDWVAEVASEPADPWAMEEQGEDVFLSWTDGFCAQKPPETWALWDAESRAALPTGTTLEVREKASVFLSIIGGGLGNGCSGVLVGEEWVLTAAHCVTDYSGSPLQASSLRVRLGNSKYGNTQILTPNAIVLDGSSWNGLFRTDYALVELPNSFSSGDFAVMEIANWPTWFAELQDANTLGYPIRTGGGACVLQSGEMFSEQDATLLDMTTHVSGRGLVKTQLDASSRQSGSPIFACPDDAYGAGTACGSGEEGVVYGVLAGVKTNGGSVVDVRGPRTPGRVYTWATGILP